MRTLIAALILVAPGLSSRLEEPSSPPDDLLKRRVVYSVPGMERVRVRRDLTYRSASVALQMDLYLPVRAAPPGCWPVVAFVHGGPVPAEWLPKDWASIP